jgi:hypothetical protein
MIFGDEYKSWISSLCNFINYPVTSPPLGPNILLRTLFSNTLCLCSCLNERNQVSHPHKTTSRIMSCIFYPLKPKVVYVLFKNSVRTSKRTPHFTITRINWLTLFKEINRCLHL